VISPDGHIEARRPHQRIPCLKGEEWCVGSSGLGVREEGGSAVGAGRRGGPQAMWCGDDRIFVFLTEEGAPMLPT
jgi:hypothetical protein